MRLSVTVTSTDIANAVSEDPVALEAMLGEICDDSHELISKSRDLSVALYEAAGITFMLYPLVAAQWNHDFPVFNVSTEVFEGWLAQHLPEDFTPLYPERHSLDRQPGTPLALALIAEWCLANVQKHIRMEVFEACYHSLRDRVIDWANDNVLYRETRKLSARQSPETPERDK